MLFWIFEFTKVYQILDFVFQDIAVISMDDSDLAQMNSPTISSVPHPKERLGEKAAENLVHMIHHAGFKATYEFDEDLIVRDSI